MFVYIKSEFTELHLLKFLCKSDHFLNRYRRKQKWVFLSKRSVYYHYCLVMDHLHIHWHKACWLDCLVKIDPLNCIENNGIGACQFWKKSVVLILV